MASRKLTNRLYYQAKEMADEQLAEWTNHRSKVRKDVSTTELLKRGWTLGEVLDGRRALKSSPCTSAASPGNKPEPRTS